MTPSCCNLSFLGSSFVITLIAGIPATFINGFHMYCEFTTSCCLLRFKTFIYSYSIIFFQLSNHIGRRDIPATFMNGFHIYCECTTYIGSSFPVELFCVNINQFYGIFLWKSFQMENFPMQLGGPDLRTHVKSIHEGVRYPCDQCDYKATQKSNLSKHSKINHKC